MAGVLAEMWCCLETGALCACVLRSVRPISHPCQMAIAFHVFEALITNWISALLNFTRRNTNIESKTLATINEDGRTFIRHRRHNIILLWHAYRWNLKKKAGQKGGRGGICHSWMFWFRPRKPLCAIFLCILLRGITLASPSASSSSVCPLTVFRRLFPEQVLCRVSPKHHTWDVWLHSLAA